MMAQEGGRPVRVYRIRNGTGTGKIPAGSALPLPDKPSVAVLPFTNMSAEPEQEFFADGIAEDVITALSRSPSLFVIARAVDLDPNLADGYCGLAMVQIYESGGRTVQSQDRQHRSRRRPPRS